MRLRVQTPDRDTYTTRSAAIGAWSQQLRAEGMIGRLAFDTYYPETGRYGTGSAMAAAEAAFVADSRAVIVQLQNLPDAVIRRNAPVAVNLVAIVQAFLADTGQAMQWLISRPAPVAAAASRADLRRVVELTNSAVPGWGGSVAATWQARTGALASYRTRLAEDADIDTVLESLLHMHHNRAIGTDRDREATCRRLARHAALAWITRQSSGR